ncbi:hypothetical protein EVAR_50865_1 [Eumeta japonica]|uniref:Uncharacterized protein n=1 Tax=Eumeta variegata TaxID=151549 RepID=A0A4C1Y867_EUMVA|nr:hypothetical protein EVAR_50865_1 [Eumeta japonica]
MTSGRPPLMLIYAARPIHHAAAAAGPASPARLHMLRFSFHFFLHTDCDVAEIKISYWSRPPPDALVAGCPSDVRAGRACARRRRRGTPRAQTMRPRRSILLDMERIHSSFMWTDDPFSVNATNGRSLDPAVESCTLLLLFPIRVRNGEQER